MMKVVFLLTKSIATIPINRVYSEDNILVMCYATLHPAMLVSWSVGQLVGLLVSWLVCWSVGRSVGLFVGWSTYLFFCVF